MSKKCSCIALSTGKKCRTKITHMYSDKRMCYIHAKKFLGKYVLLIQKIYIGYRTRKKLNTIYNKLPTEIQNIILFHMRQNHYNKKYNQSLSKILINRYYNIFTDNKYYIFNHSVFANNIDYYFEIMRLCHLFCKYKMLIPYKLLYNLYNNLSEIIYYYNSFFRIMTADIDDLEFISIKFYNTLRLYKIVCEDELKLSPHEKIYLYIGF